MMAGARSLLYPYSLPNPVSIGLFMLRLLFGGALALHGLQKMQNPMGWMGPNAPVPGILQLAAALSEFLGGLCWLAGLFTPIASVMVGLTMIVAALLAHISRGDPFVRLSPGAPPDDLFGLPMFLVMLGGRGGSWEMVSHYLAVALLLLLAGPGLISLDARLFGRFGSRRF